LRPNRPLEIKEVFRVAMDDLLSKEYEKLYRFNSLLNDMISPELRKGYLKETEQCEENIERLEVRYLDKMQVKYPEMKMSQIKELMKELKSEFIKLINEKEGYHE